MAGVLPPGIATKLVTLGRYYAGDGTLITTWTATATIDRELRWLATGDVIEQVDMQVVRTPDGFGSVRLPVDQDGFVDRAGSAARGWYYTISFTGIPGKKPKIFQLPAAALDPFDGDNVNDSAAPPASPVAATSYVNSVTVLGQGTQTGAVVIDIGSGGGSGSSTVSGITDATALGKQILLSSDQNAAQTVIGVADLRGLISVITDRIAAVEQANTALTQQIAAQNTALSKKVDATAVGVTIAPLDSAKKLPLANLTASVPLLIGNGSATIPTRPATTNPVIFDVVGATVPATGSTSGGTAAGVNGLDRQWT